jgi:glycosyltransferase involved in cell wall biosynthesis
MLGEYREYVEKELTPNIHPVYVASPRNYYRLVNLEIGVEWLYYYWWQWVAYRAAKKLHAQIGFDLAHHVTFASWRVPSFLCLLPIPLIWGPLGGGGAPPRSLRAELGWKGRLMETTRDLFQFLSRYDPLVRMTMRRAALVLTVNNDTAETIIASCRHKVKTMTAIGISATEKVEPVAREKAAAGLTVLFVALLRPIKGGTLALKAFQRFASGRPDTTLVVIGDGTELTRLRIFAAQSGVEKRVRFLGRLPRPQVQGWMQATDVLLFPTLRDSGGLVLLEAMLEGKPVICLDLAGPGEIVREDCGIKVRPGTPAQVVADLSDALKKLADDPALRQKMGNAGRQYVRERFDWDRRGEQMMEIYRRLKTATAK